MHSGKKFKVVKSDSLERVRCYPIVERITEGIKSLAGVIKSEMEACQMS